MNRTPVEWTRPYVGIQYVKKRGLSPQYTCHDTGQIAIATVSANFAVTHERIFRGPGRVEAAKAWLARLYRSTLCGAVPAAGAVCPTCGRPR